MNQQHQDQWASELLTQTLGIAWHDSEPQARKLADAAARCVAELNRDNNALLGLIADIRDAAGDPQGKLMQPELVERIRQVNAERVALAANLERLRYMLVDAKRCVAVVAYPSIYHAEQYQGLARRVQARIQEVARETPTTSLERRDALMQAAALEEAANETVPAMHQMANWLRARAAEKRRQAKEEA